MRLPRLPINYFDVSTTRRLSVSLLASSGAMFLSALDHVESAVTANDRPRALEITAALSPLMIAVMMGLFSLISAELAAHPDVPQDGQRHSKSNYLQTAFALLATVGLGNLFYGSYLLMAGVVP